MEMTQTTTTPADSLISRPAWHEEVARIRKSGSAHAFILHFNTGDYVLDGVHPPSLLRDYLVRYLQEIGCQRIGVLSLSQGLRWVSDPDAGQRRQEPATPAAPPLPEPTRRELDRMAARAGTDAVHELRSLARELRRPAEGRTGVLIERLDRLAPAGASDRETIVVTELLEGLFEDLSLRAQGVLMLATCRSLGAVAPDLAGGSAARDVLIPLPDRDTRRRLLDHVRTTVGLARLADDLDVDAVVNMTQGLTIRALDALNRSCLASGTAISSGAVRKAKQDAIEKQSGGLLEEVKPRHGFDTIGGLEHVVAYLRRVVADVRRGLHQEVPKGILLSGPPGTGKTLLAEALAREAGFNLVRMGDIRSKWVGESERNLSNVMRLLVELEPVVVFMDEIDTALGADARGNGGDSGVSSRILGRVLNFMGQNENRGKVLWIAATNRPDLLDDAMIRRFDRIFPVLLPGPYERADIFGVMPDITGVGFDPAADLHQLAEVTEGLTGSAIETVVRRGRELASGADRILGSQLLEACRDYKPNHDPEMYELQSLLAVDATNFWSALPAAGSLPAGVRELVARCRTEGSPAALKGRIEELRVRLRLARSI